MDGLMRSKPVVDVEMRQRIFLSLYWVRTWQKVTLLSFLRLQIKSFSQNISVIRSLGYNGKKGNL
jgi:hypothetical protein